jgi:4-hydroxybenzoate polyprenyltransferase
MKWSNLVGFHVFFSATTLTVVVISLSLPPRTVQSWSCCSLQRSHLEMQRPLRPRLRHDNYIPPRLRVVSPGGRRGDETRATTSRCPSSSLSNAADESSHVDSPNNGAKDKHLPFFAAFKESRENTHAKSTPPGLMTVSDSPLVVDTTSIEPASLSRSRLSKASVGTVWKMRGALFQMTRPSNIPGIVLFHLLGVHLAVMSTTTTLSNSIYWSIVLKEPLVWLSLVAITLVSASSMVVNDYYDAKLGRDAQKANADKVLLLPSPEHAETEEKVATSKLVVRQFLMYLYGMALLISNVLPGTPTRLSVTVGLMLTYLYTVHLKPITWVKNVVCASLIALAPWTSGSCALHILQQRGMAAAAAGHATGVWSFPSIWRLFGVLFLGVMGRELLMDCSDLDADTASGVKTVPVVYGSRFAAKVATMSALTMTGLATVPHFLALSRLPMSGVSWQGLVWNCPVPLRRLVIAAIGSGMQLWGSWRVVQTKGHDIATIDRVISRSLWTVILLLASFV